MTRLAVLGMLVGAAMAAGEEFDVWQEASPDKALFATERHVPDPSAPSRLDHDGCAVFICRAESGPGSVITPGEIVARHEFPQRLVSQIRWSPDSKFLLFTTVSSDGHSPWHFKMFVFCVADSSFRDVESALGGSVGALQFSFEPPDVAVVELYDPAGGAPKQTTLPLNKAMQQMERLP